MVLLVIVWKSAAIGRLTFLQNDCFSRADQPRGAGPVVQLLRFDSHRGVQGPRKSQVSQLGLQQNQGTKEPPSEPPRQARLPAGCRYIGISGISIHLSSFQTIKEVDLLTLSSLEYIDLSRNHIGEVMPGTFLGMNNLKGLDFSVNTVLKVRSPLLVRPLPCHVGTVEIK